MAGNANTIARIDVKQQYVGQEVINCYHYLLNSQEANPDLAELSVQWQLNVLPGILAVQSQNLSYNELTIKTVNRGSSEHIAALSANGSRATSNDAPPFITASYKYVRSDTSTRSGRKSLAGLDEIDFTGSLLTAAAVTLFQSAIPSLLATINTSDGDWRPIVLGKVVDAATGTYLVNFLSDVILRQTIGTQNSRKADTVLA